MVATLSHTPRPVVANFYGNSFKQLSAVQQRQVGLIVGAAVADAAARPLDGYTAAEVDAYLQARREEADAASSSSSGTDTALLPFARVRPREIALRSSSRATSGSAPASSSPPPTPLERATAAALQHHSFTYLLYHEMLRAMSRARGEFGVEFVQERLVQAAALVDEHGAFAAEHASLLHTLGALLPVPALYPYASDAALRHFADPFIDFMTTAPPQRAQKAAHDADGIDPAEAAAAERAAVRDYAVSALGVVLRQLQSNPDATRNAAFMAAPAAAAVFPADVQPFVPAVEAGPFAAQRTRLWVVQQQVAAISAAAGAHAMARWLPRRCTAADALVVREGLGIARAPVSFADGVAQAIRLGGPTCQRAMLVGALLGAKLGARHVPLDWLSATPDHKPVATMALEVAQWSWNPPQR